MSGFQKIPPAEFRALAVRPAEEVEFYGYDNVILRETFWRRLVVLDRLLCRHVTRRSICLDLGSGSGAYLPTLANRFEKVVAADRNIAEASRMVAVRALRNVSLVERDVLASPFGVGEFDAIVAADVLEHFSDTVPIANRLRDWLKPDGVLLTSLPTESWLYVLLRKILGVQKPEDHYFTGREVEATLAAAGFEPLERRFVPWGIAATSLFLVTAWRKRTGLLNRSSMSESGLPSSLFASERSLATVASAVAVSTALIALLWFSLPWGQTRDVWRAPSPLALLAAATAIALGHVATGFRIQTTLPPIPPIALRDGMRVSLWHGLAMIVLPARLGELALVEALAHYVRVRRGAGLAVLLVQRVYDGLFACAAFGVGAYGALVGGYPSCS